MKTINSSEIWFKVISLLNVVFVHAHELCLKPEKSD